MKPHCHLLCAVHSPGTTLPGYLFQPAADGGPRPTLLVCTGFDGTQEELYMNVAMAAMERGYNVLTFEGPGQGAVTREQKLYFRHDWDKVVSPVIDYALTQPEIDASRLALLGVSYGGYFAARAAPTTPIPGAVPTRLTRSMSCRPTTSPTLVPVWKRDVGRLFSS